ncbi:DNA -binding domain-containing protein [Candidatus Rariloculus sp.]|uniref:DNA -binding domain-containing protein n=1 Tax=Candidatus Rariloculus sp. TaxID=3101265 RepID=UPI003D135CC9
MASDGGPRAWAFLRRNPVYGAACREAFGHPALEVAPFPLRIQSRADRKAFAWGLLAWEIPDGTGDNPSPFWAGAPTLDGELGTEAPPLAPLLENAGARLSGLRLADGRLILKIENRSQAAQVRLRSGLVHAGLESGVATGLVLRLAFWSGPMQAIERLQALASLARGSGRDAPHPVDRELLTVLDARLAGKSWRETAVDLYGAQRVAAEWHRESWMRARVRRRDKKARFLMEGG